MFADRIPGTARDAAEARATASLAAPFGRQTGTGRGEWDVTSPVSMYTAYTFCSARFIFTPAPFYEPPRADFAAGIVDTTRVNGADLWYVDDSPRGKKCVTSRTILSR